MADFHNLQLRVAICVGSKTQLREVSIILNQLKVPFKPLLNPRIDILVDGLPPGVQEQLVQAKKREPTEPPT